MSRSGRSLFHGTIALSLLPIAFTLLSANAVSADHNPDALCSAGEVPNLTGAVTADGAAYVTNVEVLAVEDGGGTTLVSDYNMTFSLGGTDTNSSGQFGFCVGQDLLDELAQWGISNLAVVANANTGNPANSRGTTSSSVNSVACLLLNNCDFNVSMTTAILAGTASGPDGPITEGIVRVFQGQATIVASTRLDSAGRFAIGGSLTNGQYTLTVGPEGSTYGVEHFHANFEVISGAVTLGQGLGGTPTAMNIQMASSRLVGRVSTPDGTPLTGDQVESVYVIKLDPTSCPLSNPEQLWLNSCFREKYVSSGGFFTADVEAGYWFIVVTGAEYFGGYGAVVVDANGITGEVNNPQLPDTGSIVTINGRSVIDINLTSENFTGRVADPRDPNGASVPGSAVWVSKYDGNNFGFYVDQPRVRPNGEFIWKADPNLASGTYRFEVRADDSQLTPTSAWNSLAPRTHYLKFAFSGGNANVVNTCSVVFSEAGPAVTCNGTPDTKIGTQYPLYPYPANVKLTICAPGTPPTCNLIASSQGGSYAQIKQWSDQFDGFDWTDLGGSLNSTTFQTYVPSPATGMTAYEVDVSAPHDYESPLVIDPVWFTISASGVITKCSQRPTSNACPNGTGTVAPTSGGVADLGSIRFRAPRFIATVQDPDGNPIGDSGVELMRIEGDYMDWLGWETTSPNGQVGLDNYITEAGTIRLKARPPYDPVAGSTRLSQGSLDVTVTGTSPSFVLAPSSPVVTLTRPNVEGRVLAGSNPVPWTGVQVQMWNEEFDGWRWVDIHTNSDRNGEYYLSLAPGRYRLEAQAPDDSTLYTSGYIEVVVAANGNVSTVNGVAHTSGPIDISLRSPNVVGIVLAPGNPSATPAPNVGIQFEKWDDQRGYFQWVDKWAETRADGTFGTFLDAGRYRVTARPRQTNGSVSPGVAFFKVVVNGQSSTVTGCTNETDTTCSASLTGQGVVVNLQTPNVRGSVVAGGQARRGSVWVDKWSSTNGYFMWANSHAESDPVNGFSMKLDNGVYRFTAEVGGLAGYSRAVRIVRVQGSNWCEQPYNETTMTLGTECTPGLSFSPADFLLTLEAANVKANVVFDGQPVSGHSWVNVSRIDDVTGANQWLSVGAQVSNGQFWLTLTPNSGSHYRLMVNAPQPNPNNLTRKQFDLWVGDFVAGGSDRDVCLVEPVSGACPSSPIAAGSQFNVPMSQGNIQGIVTNPSGAAVGQVGINVMRREGSNWMWVESWAEASQSISTLGRFSLDLRPDSGTATYQLTARPWGGTFSPGKATIQVNSSGNWCVVTTGDACTVTGTNPSNFTIALANPNVVGRVLDTSSQPVRDAWVDLQKWVEPSGTNGQPDYRPGYWNYLSGVGDNTDGLGAFQMFIDQPGSYRVSVNPPWNESGLARFTDEFSVVASGSSLTVSGLGLNGDLQFPSPNIAPTLLMPGSSTEKVPDAWVNLVKVEGDAPNQWLNWTSEGGNSNRQGRVNLYYTTPGTYRLVVNPPWQSNSLARFTTGDFTIGANGVVSGLPSELRFPTPNVSGSVKWKSDPSSSTRSVLQNGWVGIFDTGNSRWVEGVGLRSGGRYDVYLPDGTYTLTFYPNLDSMQFAPITKSVTISDGLIFAGDLHGSTEVVFGELPPSIEVTVTFGGLPQSGAAVRLTLGSTSYTFQTGSDGKVTAYVPNGTYVITAGKVSIEGSTEVVRTGSMSGFVVNHTGGVPITASVAISPPA